MQLFRVASFRAGEVWADYVDMSFVARRGGHLIGARPTGAYRFVESITAI